jgi:hypothetical protein
MVEIHKSVGGPKTLSQFLAGHYVTRMLQQELQDLQRLLLQLNPDPLLAQLPGNVIYLERTEANGRRRPALNRHELGSPPDLGKKSLPSPFLPEIQRRPTIFLANSLAGERKERQMRDRKGLTALHIS